MSKENNKKVIVDNGGVVSMPIISWDSFPEDKKEELLDDLRKISGIPPDRFGNDNNNLFADENKG